MMYIFRLIENYHNKLGLKLMVYFNGLNKVEPVDVYKGHPWDLRNWPLNTGGR